MHSRHRSLWVLPLLLAACTTESGAPDSGVVVTPEVLAASPPTTAHPRPALPTAPALSGELPVAAILDGTSAPMTTVPPTPVTSPAVTTTTVLPCVALTLVGPLFGSGSPELTADSAAVLDDLAARLVGTTGPILIAGHTDHRPTAVGNRVLSEQRAATVAEALATRGVAADRITTVGHGDARPIDIGDDPEALARNRRVEVTVQCQ